MNAKLVVIRDKITYQADYKPLSETHYGKAAEFVQKLFRLDRNVTVPIHNKQSNPRGPYYNGFLKSVHINNISNKYPEVIAHETVHFLRNNKVLPATVTLWAARTTDITYVLWQELQAGKNLSEFNYPINKYKEKQYFTAGCKYYSAQKKDSSNAWYLHIVKEFNKMQLKKFNFFSTENYELGAFVAGIVKGILEDTRDFEQVIVFIHKLADKTPLEDAVRDALNYKTLAEEAG